MKNIFYSLSFFILLISCSSPTSYGEPEVNSLEIQKNFIDWWTYYNDNVMLSRDFIGLDANSKEITKEEFLKALADGGFIPIRLVSTDKNIFYIHFLKLRLLPILAYKLRLRRKLLIP